MKPARRWTNNELAIVLYFSSRRIGPKSVSLLLSRRGYHRTPVAVDRKVNQVVSDLPSLRISEVTWDIDAVDRWLDDLLGDPEEVNRLIYFTREDAEIVAQVGHPPNENLLSYEHIAHLNVFQNQDIDAALWSPRELELYLGECKTSSLYASSIQNNDLQ
ncbi:hypothetical protein IFM61392_10419 [Aspergillus lentulus]|nr:hypothetical protein IFM47457_10998 [Aspergillus lentulus]GFG18171.1 hypothetical protein IFM61392_10419 [Aspergillus lentulus]